MNERIKLLAEQALNYAEKNQSADIPQHWFKLHTEKFAELIVRECADWLKQPVNQTPSCGTVMNITAERLKEHFGVDYERTQ